MLTAHAVSQFVAAKSVRWKPRTIESALLHLGRFKLAYRALPTKPEPIEAFLAAIPGDTYRWNHYRTIRNFYNWMVRRQIIKASENSVPRMEKPEKPLPIPYFLEEHELVRLLSHPDHSRRDRALLFLLADTGIRIGEALSITPSSMKGTAVTVVGRTGPRFVPTNRRVTQMMEAITPGLASDDCIWQGKRGPMTIWGLKHTVRKAFRRAGFQGKRMSAHRLRHTWATIWDGSDSDGMAILGHQNYQTWQVYKHVQMRRLQAAQGQHSPLIQLLDLSQRVALERLAAVEAEVARLKQEFMTTQERSDAAEVDLVTLADAAELTGRSYRTMERWVGLGLLPEVDRVALGRGQWRIRVRRDQALNLASAAPKRFRRMPEIPK